MYIQMEFCDNQTLRSAIDKDLYKDTKRLWKMFREIIEGLLHIHSQGRDIHIECSKQFKGNSYFYVSGQSQPFWAVLKQL